MQKPSTIYAICVSAVMPWLHAFQAEATIDTNLQMQLGNPSSATANTQ